ncbi:hypothetical protein XA26_50200 [Mycolicibacterium fortuitum]|uniref:Uncharacterized protein n=2 Tax=Mycolicibacterium fortuitum TaxID=1766 RepID=A0A0N7H9E7_MYCFO|nr:DUF6361 family protein [Mycolicibacterium fortuitum]ALI28815.1 hypothetical protein XA26_50200 [Mycolicibacterium fortuitum]OBB44193.1 hypothetical protein A5754_00795 [Mycolicibacterium fortuitum]OBB79720.1 hypothetical protein A5755_07255 [Mycolicibacterium fortuitum]OBF67534.1 hypothetical protein A5751_01680 [Mycolicibacterium fortuitum]OBG11515.1 hypothetical protein A5768_11735 [Mycolicibacterium fortuitum]
MTALIAWLDASSEDQRRMREIVNLFSERESRDELGIGQVRDALSDLLWPGTSTLFTRARYFLFIPWCYRAAAETHRDVEKATALADRNERRLIRGLLDAGEKDGVVGATVGVGLKNLPSALYWGGMRVHGILNDATLSREDAIVAEVSRVCAHRPANTDYEDEAAVWHAGAFHATLPPVPAGFPAEVPDGFALPRGEAAWLRDRMLASAPDTMLEYALHHRPDTNSAVPWSDPVLMSAGGERRNVLDDARRFSILMNGASLLYNLLLAEAYEQEGFDRVENPAEQYKQRLDEWACQSTVQDDINTWNVAEFWSRVLTQNPGVNVRSRRFIDDWLGLLASTDITSLADNDEVREFIRRREQEHKRSQARLANKRLLQAWLGSSGSNQLVYRWTQLRPVLRDIHDGLERADD